jgi:hypothetical protein
MSLSRKRQKELDRLRSDATDLWGTQQAVLDRANVIAREASRQAANYSREEVAPRVRDGYDNYVRPRVETGSAAGRKVAHKAGDVITGTVVPAIGTVLGTALSVADVAQDARVKAAVKRFSSPKAVVPAKKSGAGFGTYLAIGAGIVAVIGIGYAVWQTFRADDELWVADEEPSAPADPKE